MYICVLSSPPDEPDLPYDPSAYLINHRWEHFHPSPANYKSELKELTGKGFDAFVNLCDGTPDDDLPGLGLVQAMEELGVAFTGADSKFFDPSRAEMKEMAHKAGVPTPATFFAESIESLARLDHQLNFPLLVKPPHGFASVGLTRDSRVSTYETLHEQTAHTIGLFGAALIEEFIEGREFTALAAENPDDPERPIGFQPVEFIFPPGESFKHFDMKWKDYDLMKVEPVRDPQLCDRIRDLTVRQFKAMNGTGYARCDFRMNQKGEIFMLEINPNCGIFYPPHEPGSADFILMNDPIGHTGFLDLILRSAFKRKKVKQAQKN